MVVPVDASFNVWVVLEIDIDDGPKRSMKYVNLDTHEVHFCVVRAADFHPQVRVFRKGENVNE